MCNYHVWMSVRPTMYDLEQRAGTRVIGPEGVSVSGDGVWERAAQETRRRL